MPTNKARPRRQQNNSNRSDHSSVTPTCCKPNSTQTASPSRAKLDSMKVIPFALGCSALYAYLSRTCTTLQSPIIHLLDEIRCAAPCLQQHIGQGRIVLHPPSLTPCSVGQGRQMGRQRRSVPPLHAGSKLRLLPQSAQPSLVLPCHAKEPRSMTLLNMPGQTLCSTLCPEHLWCWLST